MGLNRKRKNLTSPSPSELSISSQSGLNISSQSALNTSSPNTTQTEINTISENKEPESPAIIDDTATSVEETPPVPVVVLKKNTKARTKSSLGARKRPPTTKKDIPVEELLKKYNICDVSVDLTRCDFDKYIINRNITTDAAAADISAQIENEAICSTPELPTETTTETEIQTNQISTTIEETILQPVENTPIVTSIEEKKSTVVNLTSKKIKDLFGDSDESDFEFKRKKRKRFNLNTTKTAKSTNKSSQDTNSTQDSLDLEEPSKTKTKEPNKKKKNPEDSQSNLAEEIKTKKPKNKINKLRDVDSQNDSDEIPDVVTTSRKKRKRSSSRSKKSPKSNKSTPKRRPFNSNNSNSDSDDDFMEKPRREKKDPDIKKKINIPVPDPLNRIEHIRIRENKSYTIMHMNNISSYVKYYDNDVNLKRTESDDNQQTTTQPVVSKDKTTSMILERKNYLSNKESPEINHNNPKSSRNTNEVIETRDQVNQVIETPEPVNQVIETRDQVNQVIETRDQVNQVIETRDQVNQVIETRDHVNQVIETPEPVNQIIENPEPTNPVIENPEPTNSMIENPEPTEQSVDSLENPNSNDNIDSNDTETPDSNDTLPEIKSAATSYEKPESISDFIKRRFEKPEINTFENFRGFANRPQVNFSDFENKRRFEQPSSVSRFDISVFDQPETVRQHFDSSEAVRHFRQPETIQHFDQPETVRNLDQPETVRNLDQPETVRYFDQPENVNDSSDETQNEMKKLLKIKSNLITQIKMKRDKLDSLKRIMAYKEEHNLDDLTKTTLQFKYTLQEALVDLLSHLKTHTERNFNMLLLLGFLKIPSEMVGYNDETKSFE